MRQLVIIFNNDICKLFGSTKIKITEVESGENVPQLKTAEVILAHCKIISNEYQQDSRVLYTFVRNISFGQFISII